MPFSDRADAGRQLADLLRPYASEAPLVLGLPRGGVAVAYEVARALNAPLDVWVVRKVGAPHAPELGLGAVAEGGVVYLDQEVISGVGASEEVVEEIVRRKQGEVRERVALFRGRRPPPQVEGRVVILVDDGIATGGTAKAAAQALRAAGAREIVLAVPVASTEALEQLQPLVDAVVCVEPRDVLFAIGAWYDDFQQVEDEEVQRLLEAARGARAQAAAPPDQSGRTVAHRELVIPLGEATLEGTLSVPAAARGLVLFAHGSGSSRFSPRNRHVAAVLQGYGLATLLFDLLTADEEALDERTAELRFDIDFLASRLVEVTDWVSGLREGLALPLGYFGSSTGAAAALVAAAQRPDAVRAVVSRGGRPDLARESLPEVRAPTLLIVGGSDEEVLDLNERAYARLTSERRVAVVPGATHLFEEPGALDAVARLAGEWFEKHLGLAAAAAAVPAGGPEAGL
ncbi:MAG TPA: phosphoribosyltransferase family protein [Myxococcales bacterium]|jgi:putative phosphoribosyl transferase